MPSSREINKQNEALNEQRDLMEEISELLDSAAGQADDLGKSLSGVADLFSKINSIKCIDFEKVANYDYEKLLNFKFLKKLIKDYRNELDIRLLEYGQMTPHAIILGSK